MAVIQTGDIFKSFTFDGQDSRTYGIYITGEAVYNAPERSVEMISIPGRNGAFALDNGRFENIEVTYPAGVFGETEADFAAAVSALRNMLCSRRGYKRLSDDYNTGEYREAVYKNGLEVEPAQLRAGEFEITFECKPQRFLTSGESKSAVANNGALTNPTLFDSHPLLELKGYGNITVNGFGITMYDGKIGQITLGENTTPDSLYSLLNAPVNNGDALTFSGTRVVIVVRNADAAYPFTGFDNITSNAVKTQVVTDGNDITVIADYADIETTFGSASTLQSISISFDAIVMVSGTERRMRLSISSSITGRSGGGAQVDTVTLSTVSVPGYSGYSFAPANKKRTIQFAKVSAFSTLAYSTQTIYIDCDLGEVYMVYNGVYTSLNRHADLGAELPVLSPGSNTFTYDNTVTAFKVVPRWWKI